MTLRRKLQNFACLLTLINRCKARADTQLPRRQLHVSPRLSGIEHQLELDRWVRCKNSNAQRRARQMPRPLTAGGKRLQRLAVTDGDEDSFLSIFRGLRQPSCVENGMGNLITNRLVGKLTDCPLGADNIIGSHVNY